MVGAETREAVRCVGLEPLVDDPACGAVGVADGDRDVGRAVRVWRVGQADVVSAGGLDRELESGTLLAFAFVAA